MSRACCVFGCSSKRGVPGHRFPKDESTFNLWKSAVFSPKVDKLSNKDLRKCVVCYRHFDESEYIQSHQWRKLKPGAFPTLHLPLKADIDRIMQECGKINSTTFTEKGSASLPSVEKQTNSLLRIKISNEPDPLDISNEISSQLPVETEKLSTAGIDLPIDNKQSKSDISLPPPEINYILLSGSKITASPIQKVKAGIHEKTSSDSAVSTYKVVLGKSKESEADDDISLVETPEVFIDLCEDETNDALENKEKLHSSAKKTNIGAATYSKKDKFLKDTFHLTPENIGHICRACLKQKDALHMTENKHEEHTFSEILEMCSGIKLEEEPSLSPYICQDCINELLQAYNFREKCLKSQQTLLKYKAYLDKSDQKQRSETERLRNVTLRFHDYENILNEEDVNSITPRKQQIEATEQLDPSTNRLAKKRFYLLKGKLSGTEGFKGDVNVTEIDETNAKTLMCDTQQTAVSLQVGNAICNIKKAVVQPEKDDRGNGSVNIPKTSIVIKSPNKRKVIPYSVLLRPAINSILSGRITNLNSRILKTKKPSRKRKRNPDKVPKIRDKKPVIPGNCHICNEPHNTLAEYRQHSRVTKHYLNPYVCETCGKIYPDRHHLKTHSLISHENRKSHMCEVCGKCFKTRGYLRIHLKTHDGERKRFACRTCGKTFLTLRELAHHRRMTHTTVEKKHCCEYCGEFFARPDTLRHHRNSVHLKVKHVFCQVCGKGYQYASTLKKHMVTHSTHLINCNLCNKTFKADHRYEQHMKNQHPGATWESKEDDEIQTMSCDYCDFVCKNKQSQTVHVKVDHEANICLYCDNLFETADELGNHTVKLHDSIPDFSCRYCGRSYEEIPSLYNHLKTHKQKFYQCNVCFKKFVNSVRLKIHMVFHTREKMFACQFCDKDFLYSSSRVIHERIHTGERPYVCDICGKGHVCISSFKRHRRTHILPTHTDESLINEDAVASIELKNE